MGPIPSKSTIKSFFIYQEIEMNHFRLAVADKTYEIEILSDPRAAEVQVKVDGQDFTVKTEDLSETTPMAVTIPSKFTAPVASVSAAPAVEASQASSKTVTAPLPGKINAVKVNVGQMVNVNDPLVVIEAMKAMNIIRAQRAGKISKIYVTVGGHIAYGAPLLDIE
jgi:glutaconyl-CoA decarboxylase